jgi:hypothetical protein
MGGVVVQFNTFLTLALDRGSGQVHVLATLPLGGWVALRAVLDTVVNRKINSHRTPVIKFVV